MATSGLLAVPDLGAPGDGALVMVVDDDRSIRTLIRLQLEVSGYRVIEDVGLRCRRGDRPGGP